MTEIRKGQHIEVQSQRYKIAILIVIGLVAQLLLWATHTHARSGLEEPTQQCHLADKAAGHAPCLPHDEHDDCEICWTLASSGSVVLPPLVAPSPPKRASEQLHGQAVRQLLTAKPFASYRSRAPPLLLAR